MKIKDVKGYYLSSPYGNNKVFGQPLGVKSIGIVEVHTDDGHIGIGETYTGVYVPELIEHAVNSVKHLIIGKEFTDVETLYSYMSIPCVTMNGFIKSVIGAIEIALWDIMSKTSNISIYKLLSKDFTDKVKVYASGGSVAMNISEMHKDVESALIKGHTAYKMRVGLADWQYDLDRIKKARKILGNNDLMIDCIQGTLNKWDYETAKSRLKDLTILQPTWVEEPLNPIHIAETIKLSTYAPIAVGESLSGLFDYKNYIDTVSVDYIQLDVTHCGGFIEAMKIINLAKSKGMKVALHVWGSAISIMANMHLALACNVDWLEIPLIDLEINKELYTEHKVTNGYIFGQFNDDGLGIKIDNSIKNKYKGIANSGYNINK